MCASRRLTRSYPAYELLTSLASLTLLSLSRLSLSLSLSFSLSLSLCLSVCLSVCVSRFLNVAWCLTVHATWEVSHMNHEPNVWVSGHGFPSTHARVTTRSTC